MDIDIACGACGDGLEIVREWTGYDGLHITVRPCNCQAQAVADAARAYEQATRREAGFRERGKLFRALTVALDALDDKEERWRCRQA